MRRLLARSLLVCGALAAAAYGQIADDAAVVRVERSTHRLATPAHEAGRVAPDLPMERILLLLRRTAEQQRALDQLLTDQQNPASSRYHQWLTPEQFGQQFGPSQADLSAITRWLAGRGFQVNEIAPGRTTIEFSGTVRQVETAFHTEMHRYRVKGEEHIANSIDIAIPAALAQAVAGVVSLHDFRSRPLSRRRSEAPNYTADSTDHLLTPYDYATIYNLLPLWNAGIDGTGQSIAIVGRTNIHMSDVTTFRSKYGLPGNNTQIVLNGPDPGIVSSDEEGEAILDVTWSGAVGRGATVKFVISESTFTSDGVNLSAAYIVNNNVAPVMSMSFGLCEAQDTNDFWNTMWSQAAAEGISVFVSSGDDGSAGCDDQTDIFDPASMGFAVTGAAATPFGVAVGGTQFNDTASPSTYWNSTNSPTTQASAKGYIPEAVWNESSFTTPGDLNNGLWAGSGGVSSIYATPSWQTGTGVPTVDPGTSNQHHRYLPDISLTAASHDGYLVLQDGQMSVVSGTSASSPAMAGIMSIVNQYTGTRNGNPLPRLYALAATAPSVFHDVTVGTNAVPCAGGSPDCTAGGPYTNIGATKGYSAGVGFDLATGWGSVDANALAVNWGIRAASKATLSSPPPGSVLAGSTVTFGWNPGGGATAYWLDVGTAQGQGNIFGQNVGLVTSQAVSGIPVNGSVIWVRLWTQLSGNWQYLDYLYTAAGGGCTGSGLAVMQSPAAGSTLGATATFTWNCSTSATAYWLDVGTVQGQGNIFGQNVGQATSKTVTGIPTGIPIYVQLWTQINGSWQKNTYTYNSGGGSGTCTTSGMAAMQSPFGGSTLGTAATFTWSCSSNGSAYWLDVGTVQGQGNVFGQNVGLATSKAVTGIPTGIPIYVQLWTQINGSWQKNTYTYNTGGEGTCTAAGLAAMRSPVPESALGGTATFTWSCSSNASAYWLDVGTVQGQGNIFGQNVALATSQPVSGIPSGVPIYVRLWTQISGSWQHNDYTYGAGGSACTNTGLAAMQSPAPGSTLSSAATFTWSCSSGASAYWLDVGTVAGQGNLFGQNVGLSTSQPVSGIPGAGTIYVRLWTQINGNWQHNDYTYSAATSVNCADGSTRATMIQPVGGTIFPTQTVAFSWTSSSCATAYLLAVGSAAGASDLFSQNMGLVTAKVVGNLPNDGRVVWVRLSTQIGGTWYFNDYSYWASPMPAGTIAVTFTPNPVTGSGGQWTYQVNLQETGGVGFTLTKMTINGGDVTGLIVPIFGTARIDANGTIRGTTSSSGGTPPLDYVWTVTGTDDNGHVGLTYSGTMHLR
jgi:hypothetical protein